MKHLTLYNTHFQALLAGFQQAIRAKGYMTGKYHGSTVQEFFSFLEGIGIAHISEVKAKHVIEYYEHIKERPNEKREGGLSDSSLRAQIYILRLLFDHLIDSKVLAGSPIHLPRFAMVQRNERIPASVEEIKLLYGVTESRRDRAILALAYGCGLRRTEIEMLDTPDIQFSRGTLVVRMGKNGKTRTVPLSESVIRDLREYLVNERAGLLTFYKSLSPAFLLDRYGKRTDGYLLNERVKRLVKRTKNRGLMRKGITLHSLRHSIATHLLDKGADIDFVRRFLGHTMLDTTHIYSKRRKQRRMLLEQFEQSGKAA
jgi:integrase/recombinase XerD